jgi:acyl carrier protein
MYTLDDITEFVAKQTGVKPTNIAPESCLVEDLGVEGDDFFELAHAFAEHFNVDMSSYRWYFHHAEEGIAGLGALFFPPPNKRVGHIPVRITLLLDAANTGRWTLEYPPHQLPARRYDLIINSFVLIVCVLATLLATLHHFKVL